MLNNLQAGGDIVAGVEEGGYSNTFLMARDVNRELEGYITTEQ